jgi:hypothetical protein
LSGDNYLRDDKLVRVVSLAAAPLAAVIATRRRCDLLLISLDFGALPFFFGRTGTCSASPPAKCVFC